jgi:alpha-L-fucosidase
MKRRDFLRVAGAGSVALALGDLGRAQDASMPSYLKGYEEQYKADPRKAALKWFSEARFGLFMHYGLYSILGRHEWVQFRESIPVAEYAKLKDQFTAEKFNADFITDLVLAANMKYVNITTRHHDSFCLFDTAQTDFKSTNSPAKRDLVKELADSCAKKGLGLCLYYSHGRDWRHPHAPNNDEWGGSARPKYKDPEPAYATGSGHDLQKYVAFVRAQVTELLKNYGPIAAIWLDGIATPLSRKERVGEFHCQELYDHIHSLQPQVLVSYKQGLLGTEDFMAPERHWKGVPPKPLELCDTLQPGAWGYTKADDGKHKSADEVMKMLAKAAALPANLLLNTGPLPDGSIHSEDVTTLREVGRRIRETGYPKAVSSEEEKVADVKKSGKRKGKKE